MSYDKDWVRFTRKHFARAGGACALTDSRNEGFQRGAREAWKWQQLKIDELLKAIEELKKEIDNEDS